MSVFWLFFLFSPIEYWEIDPAELSSIADKWSKTAITQWILLFQTTSWITMWDIQGRDWKVALNRNRPIPALPCFFGAPRLPVQPKMSKHGAKYFSDFHLDFTPKIILNLWISDFHGRLMIAIAQTRHNLWEGGGRNLSTWLLSSPSAIRSDEKFQSMPENGKSSSPTACAE